MSRATNVLIAVIIGVAVSGGFNSVGYSQGGVLDELMLGLVPFIALGFLVFGVYAAIRNAPPGGAGRGGGGGGVSPADLQQFETRLTAQFTQLGQAVTHVGADVTSTRQIVTQVQADVTHILQGLRQWTQRLGQLLGALTQMSHRVGQSVQDIQQRVRDIDNWRQNVWPQFEQWVRGDVGTLLTEGRAMAGEIGHLRGEVQAVQQGQAAVGQALVSLQSQQVQLQNEVRTGFGAVPAGVGAEVQGRLDAVRVALSGEISASAHRLEGLLASLTRGFVNFENDLDRRLTAANVPVRREVLARLNAVRDEVVQELASLAHGQVGARDALARIEAAQGNLRQGLADVVRDVPPAVVAAMQPQVQRLTQALSDGLAQVSRDQQGVSTAMQDLAVATRAQTQVAVASIQAMQDDLKQNLEAELAALAGAIANELEPLTREMGGISAQMIGILQKIGEQGQSIDWLRTENAQGFAGLNAHLTQVRASLEKIDKEGAKASVLENVYDEVTLINDWLADHGHKLEQLAVQLPNIAPLLDKLRELIPLLEKKRRRANDAAGQTAQRQNEFRWVYGNIRFNYHKYSEHASLFFATLEVMHQYLLQAAVPDDQKGAALKRALPLLMQDIDLFCTGKDSSRAQLEALMDKLAVQDPTLPPEVVNEVALVVSICPNTGDLYSRFTKKVPRTEIEKLRKLFLKLQSAVNATPADVAGAKDAIDKMKRHGAFKKVVERMTPALEAIVRPRAGI